MLAGRNLKSGIKEYLLFGRNTFLCNLFSKFVSESEKERKVFSLIK